MKEQKENQFKIGDIVKVKLNGNEIAGIVYEVPDDTLSGRIAYRVEVIGRVKIRYLQEEDLTQATPEELAESTTEAGAGLTPEAIINREAEELAVLLAEMAEIKAQEAKGGDDEPEEE